MQTQGSGVKNIFITRQLFGMLGFLLAILLGIVVASSAFATDPASVPKKKQTSVGIYYTPAEAYDRMLKHGERTLFIDVRDPVEVNYTGMPTVADANIPFQLADTSKFHMKKKQFDMKPNDNFLTDVDARLKAKGLTKSDTIILMCRSGVRSAKAANALAKAGYTKVYNLTEGFEGDTVKEGQNRGQRTVNGWKNAGTPWDTPKDLDINKMYGNPEPVVPK